MPNQLARILGNTSISLAAVPCLVGSDADQLPLERAGACNHYTARLIPRSWLLGRCGERGDYVIR